MGEYGWEGQKMERMKTEREKEDKGERKLSSGTEWNGGEQIEMI